MDVTYLRYQDDILILCKTKRQMIRCKQRMMNVLKERRLSLSHKKTRIGHIDHGFHFLGIHYPETQTPDYTDMTQANEKSVIKFDAEHYLASLGGGKTNIATDYQKLEANRIVPHPRTLRKAREQVKQLVIDGTSSQRIRSYLHRWVLWWVRSSESWDYIELVEMFLNTCWELRPAAYAAGLLNQAIQKLHTPHALAPRALGYHAIA